MLSLSILMASALCGAGIAIARHRRRQKWRRTITHTMVGRRLSRLQSLHDVTDLIDGTALPPERQAEVPDPQFILLFLAWADDIRFSGDRAARKALNKKGWLLFPAPLRSTWGDAAIRLQQTPAVWLIGEHQHPVEHAKMLCEIGKDEWVYDESAQYLIDHTLPGCIRHYDGEKRLWGRSTLV